MTAVVSVEHFRMDFGSTTVVRDLSFEIMEGETFGFLGSNGSGKTTTIRALLDIYIPTAGKLLINGAPFHPSAGLALGYLPEERGLYKKERVIDTMVFFGRLKGMAPAAARQWSMNYLEQVELADKAKTRLDKLSGGQQQKVQLGVTIMNDPQLLILDEPTKGFDPVNRRLLLDIIAHQKRRGATVMMVTHQMEEVERLCDRIILLKDGVARAYGTVAEVQAAFGNATIQVAYTATALATSPPAATPISPHAASIAPSVNYRILSDDAGQAELLPAAGAEPGDILRELITQGVRVTEYRLTRRSLDSIFVEVYGKDA